MLPLSKYRGKPNLTSNCVDIPLPSITKLVNYFLIEGSFPNSFKKDAHVTPILKQLYWLPVKYRCICKTATLVYKFLHSGSSYFEPFLSLSSCPYSTRHSHPNRQYLTIPPFHSSVFKSLKHFGHSFAFDAPKIWN